MRWTGLVRLAVGLAVLLVSFVTIRRLIGKTMFNQVRDFMVRAGIRLDTANYIAAQSGHETGNFLSKIFRENNNLFGMKLALIRPTRATGKKYGHASYDTVEDSMEDYLLWANFVDMPRSFRDPEEFVLWLKLKGYFEAPIEEYLEGVNHFLKLYSNV